MSYRGMLQTVNFRLSDELPLYTLPQCLNIVAPVYPAITRSSKYNEGEHQHQITTSPYVGGRS